MSALNTLSVRLAHTHLITNNLNPHFLSRCQVWSSDWLGLNWTWSIMFVLFFLLDLQTSLPTLTLPTTLSCWRWVHLWTLRPSLKRSSSHSCELYGDIACIIVHHKQAYSELSMFWQLNFFQVATIHLVASPTRWLGKLTFQNHDPCPPPADSESSHQVMLTASLLHGCPCISS